MSVTARRFLLGQLPVDDAATYEERLLQDDELVEETDAVRAELYDEYVRNELTEDERRAFARRFDPQPNELAFAHALSTRTKDRWRGTIRNVLPIAASIVILASVTLLWLRPEPAVAPLPIPRATLKPEPAPAIPAPELVARARNIAIVTIALTATRDDEESPSLTLARDLDDVALRIRINPADRFDDYAIELTTSSGAPVWSGRAVRDAATSELTATIPASDLTQGNHQIAVSGIAADGTREELGYQTLVIREP